MKNPIIRPVHTPFCPILLTLCRRQLAAACRSRLRDGSGDPRRVVTCQCSAASGPPLPRCRTARHVVGVRMRVPLPGAPRSTPAVKPVDRPARPSGPVRGTVESRYSRGAPATGSGTPAPQGGRDRTRRFILHRFTFESVRAIRYCFVPLAPRRAAGHSRAASAGMERGPPRPANTRRETERAECQSERSEKCLQIAVKRGKGWTLECASFLR